MIRSEGQIQAHFPEAKSPVFLSCHTPSIQLAKSVPER